MKKQSKNETDIVGLITGIQQQLAALEKKVDVLLGQSVQKPAEIKPFPKPFQQPFLHPVSSQIQTGNRQDNRFQSGNRGDNRFQTAGQRDNRFQSGNRQDNRQGERLMHKAICADCKKQCEVPFMPREGRPVYCQECFSRRKSNGPFTASINNRPKELMSAKAIQINKQQISEKTKPVTKKKITATKKTAAKKSKKK